MNFCAFIFQFADLLLQELYKHRGFTFVKTAHRSKHLQTLVSQLVTRDSSSITCPLLQAAVLCYPLMGPLHRNALDYPLLIGPQLLASRLIPSYLAHLLIGAPRSELCTSAQLPTIMVESNKSTGVLKSKTYPSRFASVSTSSSNNMDKVNSILFPEIPVMLDLRNTDPLALRIVQIKRQLTKVLETLTKNLIGRNNFNGIHSVSK